MLTEMVIPVSLILAGAAIMVFNITKYFSLTRQLSDIYMHPNQISKKLLILYLILLVFFLIGYLIVAISLLFSRSPANPLLLGFIFFFGSVFVLLGLFLQLSLSKTVQKSSIATVRTLVSAIEARDVNLNGHSIHVAKLSLLIYRYLPREKQQKCKQTDLEYAALLHDIGKLGIAESILNKTEPLSDEDWDEIKKHPQIGKEILSSLDNFSEISNWILYHHERYDGLGYFKIPYEEIPFPSLIISVADTFSALTMNRSYRTARAFEEAMEIIQQAKGTQLDPEIVAAFSSIPKEEIESCTADFIENALPYAQINA